MSHKYIWKLIVWDENAWNHVVVYKFCVLWIDSWIYICMQMTITQERLVETKN